MEKNADNWKMREEDGARSLTVTRALVASAESTAEEILPDYKGEIKRVLLDTARAVPSGNYLGGGEASFTGTVVYTMLYLDAEGALSSAEFTSGYEITVPVPEGTSGAFADATVSAYSIRPSGPRKVSLRATVTADILLSETKDLSVSVEGAAGVALEEKRIGITSREVVAAASGEREYADEATKIEGISPEAIEILGAGGNVRIESRRAARDGILLSGTVELTAIIRAEGEAPYAVADSIPFEELLPYGRFPGSGTEEAESYQPTFARGVLTSAAASVVADPDRPDSSSVTLNAIAEFFATAERNTAAEAAADAYAIDGRSEEKFEELAYGEFLCAGTEAADLSFSVGRAEVGAADADSVIFTFARAAVRDVAVQGGRAIVRGEIMISSLADRVLPDGKIEYFPLKKTENFEQNVKFNCQIPDDATIYARVSVDQARGSLDENDVYFNVALKVEAAAIERKTATYLSSVKTAESDRAEKDGAVRVFYPAAGDTLWKVAKRYGKPVHTIAAANLLTEEQERASDTPASLAGVKKLMIF